jgi:ubiquinone/menaquinone biosynthesis C-methylase UbiE
LPEPRTRPPRRTVLIGKSITRLTARAPWLWPLVRGRVAGYFDAAAPGWDDRTAAGSADHLAALAAGVLQVPGDPERVLEIGCGTGAGTLFLAREYPRARIRGVDISPAMVSRATAKIGLDPEARVAFRVADGSDLPYPEDSFDLVAQINTPVFFSEIARVLRPGGTALVTSSLGDETPFSTPEPTLRAGFSRVGMSPVASGMAGEGTWFAVRKEPRK